MSTPFKGCYASVAVEHMTVPCGKRRKSRGLCETHFAARQVDAAANKKRTRINPRRRMKTKLMRKEGISGNAYARLRAKALRLHRRRTKTLKLRSVAKLAARYASLKPRVVTPQPRAGFVTRFTAMVRNTARALRLRERGPYKKADVVERRAYAARSEIMNEQLKVKAAQKRQRRAGSQKMLRHFLTVRH